MKKDFEDAVGEVKVAENNLKVAKKCLMVNKHRARCPFSKERTQHSKNHN